MSVGGFTAEGMGIIAVLLKKKFSQCCQNQDVLEVWISCRTLKRQGRNVSQSPHHTPSDKFAVSSSPWQWLNLCIPITDQQRDNSPTASWLTTTIPGFLLPSLEMSNNVVSLLSPRYATPSLGCHYATRSFLQMTRYKWGTMKARKRLSSHCIITLTIDEGQDGFLSKWQRKDKRELFLFACGASKVQCLLPPVNSRPSIRRAALSRGHAQSE